MCASINNLRFLDFSSYFCFIGFNALPQEGLAQRVDIPFKENLRIGVMLEFHHLRKIDDDRLASVPKNIERGVIAVNSA